MTFEDYKKQVEVFGKIDTAEKLSFYKQQYENHLLQVEDETYFEPYEGSLESGLSCDYERNLNQIFNLSAIEENQFYFLVKPSFEPENLLVLTKQADNYILTHTILVENYWGVFYADKNITAVDKTEFTSELAKDVGDKLSYLLDRTIADARHPRANIFTLDGVVYILSKIVGDKPKSVFKHSPNGHSKSGKIIAIMEQLIDNIQKLDNATVEIIANQIDSL